MEKNVGKWFLIIALVLICILIPINKAKSKKLNNASNKTSTKTFNLISSSENKDLEQILQSFARANNIRLNIDGSLTVLNQKNL